MNVISTMRMYWRIALFGLIVLIPLGCAQPATIIHLTGKIAGQQLAAGDANASVGTGIAAQLSCDNHVTTASATGAFHLDMPITKANTYICTVSALPSYQTLTTTLAIAKAGNYSLNFIINAPTSSPCTTKGREYDCPFLQFMPGKIVATLTYKDSKHLVPHAHLRCTTQHATATNTIFFGDVDAQGDYVIASLPPDTYTCIAYDPDFVVLPPITVPPAQAVTTQATLCELQCPHFRFHDGVVMHNVTAYLIFWLPTGKTFDATHGTAAYEQKMGQFITDVSGTPYFNTLTQYADFSGPIQNNITLGGTYVETQPYPHAGTRADPLTDSDVESEIAQAKQANSTWVQSKESIFVVFTSYNTEECNYTYCSFDHTRGFCGYHSADSPYGAQNPLIYAIILDSANCAYTGVTPNDGNIDAAIDILDHEIAEAATDPDPFSGWNNDALNPTPQGGEIGDLCEDNYFSTRADGGNITLHGHDYLIQPLWSDKANACAYSG